MTSRPLLALTLALAALGCAHTRPTRFGPVEAPDCALTDQAARDYVRAVAHLLRERPQSPPPAGLRLLDDWDGDPRSWVRTVATDAGPVVEVRLDAADADPRLQPGLVARGVGMTLQGEWQRLPPFARAGLSLWFSSVGAPEVDRQLRLDAAVRGVRSLALTVELAREHERGLETIPLQAFRGSSRHPLTVERLFEREDFYDGTDVLGWLLVARIVEVSGLDELAAICDEAAEQGRAFVSPDALVAAAQLDFDRGSWAAALGEAVAPLDPIELAKALNVPREAWALEGAEATGELVVRFAR